MRVELEEGAPPSRARQEVAKRENGDEMVVWSRTSDGVEVEGDLRSVWSGDRWRTVRHRELVMPEPVREAELLPLAEAARRAGLAEGFAAGRVTARRLHRPEYAQAPGKAVQGAADVELVVKRYRLLVELDDAGDGTLTWLDAYTGERVGRASKGLGATAVQLTVGTARYGARQINAVKGPYDIPTHTQTYFYEDLARSTCRETAIRDAGPICGQGILSAHTPCTYARVVGLGVPNDVAFSLQESWDFFASTFARRGLRNLSPSPTPGNCLRNDAVAWFSQACKAPEIMVGSGMIEIGMGCANWQAKVALDTIGHEWSHGVIESKVPGISAIPLYAGSNGGMMEATADLYGELIEARGRYVAGQQPNMRVRDGWVFGNDTVMRDMCRPSLSFVPGRNVWSPDLDDPTQNVEAHAAAGPLDRVFCLVSDGLAAWNPLQPDPWRQSLRAPIGFSGLGSLVVGRMQYRALDRLASAHAAPFSYADMYAAVLGAAEEQTGAYSPLYKAVQDAFCVIEVTNTPADREPPVVSITSGTVSMANDRIIATVTPNTSGAAIVSVAFQIDGTTLATLTAPPWEVHVPPSVTDGPHVVAVAATDAHQNVGVAGAVITVDLNPPAVVLEDATPCTSPSWCPEGRTSRTYRVTATDFSGVSSIDLTTPWQTFTASSSPATFPVTFSAEGSFTITARATDTLGNAPASSQASTTALVDFTAPVFTSQVASPHLYDEGWERFDFCVSDASPLAFHMPTLFIDGAPQPNHATPLGSCWLVEKSGLSIGTHTFEIRVNDHWGNERSWSGSFTTVKVPPLVNPPVVTLGTAGTASVAVHYYATNGVASVSLSKCTTSCTLVSTFVPVTAADQANHVFSVSGLTLGTTYTARVTVTGQNGLTGSNSSAPFTVPTGDVVFNEIEPNDSWQGPNVVGTQYNVIRGSLPPSSWVGDYFIVYVTPGKYARLDVVQTSGFPCAGGIVGSMRSPFTGEMIDRPGREYFKSSRAALAWNNGVAGGCPSGTAPSNCLFWAHTFVDNLCASLGYDVVVRLEPY